MRTFDPALLSSAWSSLLIPFEYLYRAGVAWQAARTARNLHRGRWPLRLSRPVVSVGNLTAGGTGKTPVVEALCRAWRVRGGRPAILSRGYRGGQGGNDEFRLLARRLPDVPHVQDPDRHRGGLRLLAAHPEVDLLVLDDGFQHRRLHRDVDLVVLDATRPFGYGHCLPRGLLREPWQGLRRATGIIVTRCAEANPDKAVLLRTFLAQFLPRTPVWEARAEVQDLTDLAGARLPLAEARSRRWLAFAGLGNPTAFFRMLTRLGLPLIEVRAFPDHHPYRASDVRALADWATRRGASGFLTTEKDGVKFAAGTLPGLWQVPLSLHLRDPGPLDVLRASLDACRPPEQESKP